LIEVDVIDFYLPTLANPTTVTVGRDWLIFFRACLWELIEKDIRGYDEAMNLTNSERIYEALEAI
jgi:hypothetical protein